MLRIVLIGIGIAVAGLASAGPVERVARPCLIERLPQAKAACLSVIADARLNRVEARIANATADLQAATASEIQAYQRGLNTSQQRWRDRLLTECRAFAAGDQVAFQSCRLSQIIDRDEAVRTTLNQARAEMGMTSLIEVPDEIEVLIPLPSAPAGPDADLRVPLVAPIQP